MFVLNRSICWTCGHIPKALPPISSLVAYILTFDKHIEVYS